MNVNDYVMVYFKTEDPPFWGKLRYFGEEGITVQGLFERRLRDWMRDLAKCSSLDEIHTELFIKTFFPMRNIQRVEIDELDPELEPLMTDKMLNF